MAEQWVAGVVAGEVGVGQLAAVATLVVAVVVAVAEEGPLLVYHERQHGNTCTVLDTTGLQTVRNFSSAGWSTSLCPNIFLFFFFFFTTVQLECSSTMFITTLSFSSKSSPSFKTGSGAVEICGI